MSGDRPGQVIILNGTSSAGKTTPSKAPQHCMDEPFLEAGLDRFLWALPLPYLNTDRWQEVFAYEWPSGGGHERLVIRPGPIGHTLVRGMHRAVAALATAGNNVIMDHVLLDSAWVRDCADALSGCRVLFVGVICPLEVVEERERARKDRTIGQARAQIDAVHAHGAYDLQVDTSQMDPETAAATIRKHLAALTASHRSVLERFRDPITPDQ